MLDGPANDTRLHTMVGPSGPVMRQDVSKAHLSIARGAVEGQQPRAVLAGAGLEAEVAQRARVRPQAADQGRGVEGQRACEEGP